MKPDDSYLSWLEKRRSLGPSPEFSGNLAVHVARYERQQREAKPSQDMLGRWLEWVSRRPIAQAAIILAGLALGAVRLLATLQIILSS